MLSYLSVGNVQDVDLKRIAARIDVSRFPFLDPKLEFEQYHDGSSDNLMFTWTARVKHRDTGEWTTIYFHSTFPFRRYSEDEAVNQIYHSLKLFVLHELDECFLFDGKRIFDPHKNGR